MPGEKRTQRKGEKTFGAATGVLPGCFHGLAPSQRVSPSLGGCAEGFLSWQRLGFLAGGEGGARGGACRHDASPRFGPTNPWWAVITCRDNRRVSIKCSPCSRTTALRQTAVVSPSDLLRRLGLVFPPWLSLYRNPPGAVWNPRSPKYAFNSDLLRWLLYR